MTKFTLIPDEATYGVRFQSGVIYVGLEGGVGRTRKDFDGASRIVDVSFFTNDLGYQYLVSFFETIIDQGAIPFEIDLLIDNNALEEYSAIMIPGSFSLDRSSGTSHTVSMQLEVEPQFVDDDYNSSYFDLYSAYGDDTLNWLNTLEFLTNTTMPATLF
jgi:hypothetical protein